MTGVASSSKRSICRWSRNSIFLAAGAVVIHRGACFGITFFSTNGVTKAVPCCVTWQAKVIRSTLCPITVLPSVLCLFCGIDFPSWQNDRAFLAQSVCQSESRFKLLVRLTSEYL